jgi:hypothetical protein
LIIEKNKLKSLILFYYGTDRNDSYLHLMLFYRFGAFEEFKSWYAVDNVLTPDKRLLCGLGKMSYTCIYNHYG